MPEGSPSILPILTCPSTFPSGGRGESWVPRTSPADVAGGFATLNCVCLAMHGTTISSLRHYKFGESEAVFKQVKVLGLIDVSFTLGGWIITLFCG